MTKDVNALACEEFQAQLPELIGSSEKLAMNLHIQHCPRCRGLLSDLKTIAEAAHELLPVVEPPDEVWKHIEAAIRNEQEPRESEGSRE
jgi:Zn-finger nucleic acid-binding protein